MKSKTCIAVVKNKNGRLVMAADSRINIGSSDYQKSPIAKIVKKDGLLLGATGCSYLCTLLTHVIKPPKLYTDNITSYIHHQFYDKVINLLKSKHYFDNQNNLKISSYNGCEVLIGVSGRLFSLTIANEDHIANIGIVEMNTPYATGCGGALAWGSLLSTENLITNTKERLILALQVASKVSSGCDDNITIISE